MYKTLLTVLSTSLMALSPIYSGFFDSTQKRNPFELALKEAKGKDKEEHKMSGIDFVYVVTAKKCHRYDALKRSFGKYNVNPYRFTTVSPSEINFRTMQRACLHGSRRYSKFMASTVVRERGRTSLKKKKMSSYNAGYVHQKMSTKKLSVALSHISCIKDAIDSGYQTIWIMDSGTELRVDPNVLSSYILRADKEIPDWTSLYTDIGERDFSDRIRPLKKFFCRPDFRFLEPEAYFNRMFEGQADEPKEKGSVAYSKKNSDIVKNNGKYFLGRGDFENHKKSRESRELLAVEEWENDQMNDSFTQETLTTDIIKAVPSQTKDAFTKVGLLKGAHSYILNKKGMKLIMDWYLDHQIFIPYAQEIQIIPGMNPYYIPMPVTRNQNRG